VQDISPGPGSSRPSGFRKSGARVYFAAVDPEHGEELWSGFAGIVTGLPAVAVADLRTLVVALDLPHGVRNGLLGKVDAAAEALAAGDPSRAIAPLRGFLHALAAARNAPTGDLVDLAEQTLGLLGADSPQRSRP
jgi:hypothetical protein